MKFFDLIFELVRNHVPIKREDWAEMYKEMEDDTARWTKTDENWFKRTYAEYNDKWWVRLGFAISFIYLTKAIGNYLRSPSDDVEDETF